MTDLTHIAEPLRRLARPIVDLNEDPANARRHPQRNLESIEASLRRFGQRLPLVVQEDGMIVRAGNGRLAAARSLGWTHLACVVVDESSVDATAFAIADNRTGELALWDYDELERTLSALRDDGVDLIDVGWLDEEIEGLGLAAEWEPHDDHLEGTAENVAKGATIKLTPEETAEVAIILGVDEVTKDTLLADLRARI